MLLLFHLTDFFDGLIKSLLLFLSILAIFIIINPLLNQRQKSSVILRSRGFLCLLLFDFFMNKIICLLSLIFWYY